jgi:hypothetical protein
MPAFFHHVVPLHPPPPARRLADTTRIFRYCGGAMLNSSITSFKLRIVAPGKLPPLVHVYTTWSGGPKADCSLLMSSSLVGNCPENVSLGKRSRRYRFSSFGDLSKASTLVERQAYAIRDQPRPRPRRCPNPAARRREARSDQSHGHPGGEPHVGRDRSGSRRHARRHDLKENQHGIHVCNRAARRAPRVHRGAQSWCISPRAART